MYLLLLLCFGVSVTQTAPTEQQLQQLIEKNFLSSGQRTRDDVEAVRKRLDQLQQETKKQLMSKTLRRNMLLSVNQQDATPVERKTVDDEESINKESGISYLLYQGDIAMTADALDEHLGLKQTKRSVIHDSNYPKTKWENNLVPYYFDASLPTFSRQKTREAMDFWESHTCLTFKEDQSAPHKLRIFYGTGCWSYVGRDDSKPTQDLSFGPGCEKHFGVLTHELGHALGFFHEQARFDRDDYISLNLWNAEPNRTSQFNKESEEKSSTQGTNYEYGSIMHYASDHYALDPKIPVIVAKDKNHSNTMGQRMRPSFMDVWEMNNLYDCNKNCSTNNCKYGGYPNPKNCQKCICTHGYGGDHCDEIEPPTEVNNQCGGVLRANHHWQSLYGVVRTNTTANEILTRAEQCWWRIEADEGKRVKIDFKLIRAVCMPGCVFNNVEIKTNNFTYTGYRMCCKEKINSEFISDGPVLVLGVYARTELVIFQLFYTQV